MKIKKVNILGDSITWGYAPMTGEKLTRNYSELLKEKMSLEVLNNYGINSSTLASGENAFEPMCLRYKQMEDDVDLVIVFGGTNDYGRDDFCVKLGNKEDTDITTVYGALREICVGLKQKYPNTNLLFITPLQRAFLEKDCKLKYATKVKNKLGYTLEDVRNAIKEICQMYEIDVFDLYEECGIDTKEDCLKYLPDGLHPTEEYHQILAEKIVEYINEIKEKNDARNMGFIR